MFLRCDINCLEQNNKKAAVSIYKKSTLRGKWFSFEVEIPPNTTLSIVPESVLRYQFVFLNVKDEVSMLLTSGNRNPTELRKYFGMKAKKQ